MMRSAFLTLLLALASVAGCAPSVQQQPNQSSTPVVEKPQPPQDAPGPRAEKTKDAPPSSPKRTAGPSLDERMLFYPSKYPEGDWKPKGLTFEDVRFDAEDGTHLHGWYCPCDRPRAVVLFAHGNAGNLSHRAPLMQYLQKDLRVSVLIFDYRGYGRSEGVPTVEGILKDGRAARSLLARRAGIKESQVVLMGRSLGGAVVVQLAAESPPRGLILESTFSSFKDVAAHHYRLLAWLVSAKKLDSAAKIATYKGPLLQSHGDADRIIPYASGRKLFEAANEPKRFVTIPGGDHNDRQSAEYFTQLNRFLDTLPDG
jgi:hypothetical protein